MFPGGGIWVRRAEGVRREEHDAIRKGKRVGGTDYAELLDLIYQLSVCSNGDRSKSPLCLQNKLKFENHDDFLHLTSCTH